MKWVVFGIALALADILVVTTVVRVMLLNIFRPLAEAYPPRDPHPDAVVRRFQSFRFGLVNMDKSMHVAADEDHLHLVPVRVLRWAGARACSVPWEALEDVEPAGFRKKWRRAKIGRIKIMGPPWCLDLAPAAKRDA